MCSYYDDPDFAAEYRSRDEEALDAAITEKEQQVTPHKETELNATES